MVERLSKDHKLWVVESNGSPRSGKGSINAHLANTVPGSDKDETGADYRATTFGLVLDGHIEMGMDRPTIEKIIQKLGESTVADYPAQRHEIVAEHGEDVLYTGPASLLVDTVAAVPIVRHAVKTGFARRVQRQVENPDTHILFVDGRNLTPVIKTVEGANILLRLFVDCQPFVATHREAARQGIDLSDPANENWYRDTLQQLESRSRADEVREHDAVKVEDNAISYWFNRALSHETAERVARRYKLTFAAASRMLSESSGSFKTGGRYGAGVKALAENRQIYFDTTEISKNTMLTLALRMFEEAHDHSAGLYTPASNRLIEV